MEENKKMKAGTINAESGEIYEVSLEVEKVAFVDKQGQTWVKEKGKKNRKISALQGG